MSTPKRLPDRIWCSLDVWAQLGPIVDTARLVFPSAGSAAAGSSSLATFAGNIFDLPRIVVPGFPGGTCLIGHASDYEVYEEVVGLLSAVEPALFGVQVAYGGYVAMNAVTPEGLCKVLPPAGGARAAAARAAPREHHLMAVCRCCDADIHWERTVSGKAIPLNTEPTPDGNVVLRYSRPHHETRAVVLHHGEEPYSSETRFVTHFTCPQLQDWRRR